jgi:dGTPase
MPDEFSGAAQQQDETGKARVVADYIAGMTDRYAIAEHERIAD